MSIDAYPLHYPIGWSRTSSHQRQRARFEVTFAVARDELIRELELLGAKHIIISSNVPLRQDGLPYAKSKQPEDPGVAVYFQLGKKPHVLACDRWNLVKDNIRAIGLHVAALRGQLRWGVGSIEQAFMGYQALPESSNGNGQKPWWEVLDCSPSATLDEIKAAYRNKAHLHHPDRGGDPFVMTALNEAYVKAKQEK